jgi:hypothetical protein
MNSYETMAGMADDAGNTATTADDAGNAVSSRGVAGSEEEPLFDEDARDGTSWATGA